MKIITIKHNADNLISDVTVEKRVTTSSYPETQVSGLKQKNRKKKHTTQDSTRNKINRAQINNNFLCGLPCLRKGVKVSGSLTGSTYAGFKQSINTVLKHLRFQLRENL